MAAGAVAEQIAPKIKPIAIESGKFPETVSEIAKMIPPTIKKGVIDSKSKMPTNCFPYFLITLSFNSAPIKKPISESETVLTGLSEAMVALPKSCRPLEPIIIPITM